MTDLVIVLGAIATLLLIFLVFVGKICLDTGAELHKVKEKYDTMRASSTELRKINEELALSIYDLTAENNRLRNGCDDAQRISELKFQLCQKQEKIDELQTRLKEYRMLLKQKWEGSRHG